MMYRDKLTRSRLFKIINFVFTLLEILLASGITYGWASIIIVFMDMKFFENLCPAPMPQNSTMGNTSTLYARNAHPDKTVSNNRCIEQGRRFNLIFNVAVAVLGSAKLPIGIFVDKYGPRAGQIFGGTIYIIGGFTLAFVTTENANILFLVFILFSIGGGFIAVSKYQVSRIIYTRLRSLALSVLQGAFDSSAIVLLLFKLVYDSGISLRDISLFYTSLIFVMTLISLIFLTPRYSDLLEQAAINEPSIKRKKPTSQSSDSIDDDLGFSNSIIVPVCLIPETLWSSICSPQYLLELCYLCIIQLRLWFFIGSLNELLNIVHPSDAASVNSCITYFGYIQFFGIAIGPMVGYMFDRNVFKCKVVIDDDELHLQCKSRAKICLEKIHQSILPFFITNFLCVIFSVLVLTNWKPGLIISFILHVVTRGFLYASHASFIGIAFRPEKFGTLFGLGVFAAALFGLLEYPFYKLSHAYLHNDPFWVRFLVLIDCTFHYLSVSMLDLIFSEFLSR
eukprot:gene14361-15857_t